MSSNIQGGANTGRTTTVRPGGRGSETKHSLRTTELPIYVLAVMGLLIASAVADAQDFGTQEAWKYITAWRSPVAASSTPTMIPP